MTLSTVNGAYRKLPESTVKHVDCVEQETGHTGHTGTVNRAFRKLPVSTVKPVDCVEQETLCRLEGVTSYTNLRLYPPSTGHTGSYQ